jgi:hypothetical protein
MTSLPRPKTGDLFEKTINTSKGPVDMLAEVVVEGDTIHLKDIVIYPRTAQPLMGLEAEILAARTQIALEAKQHGFKQLRITGKRLLSSSSANPGREIDVTMNLTAG